MAAQADQAVGLSLLLVDVRNDTSRHQVLAADNAHGQRIRLHRWRGRNRLLGSDTTRDGQQADDEGGHNAQRAERHGERWIRCLRVKPKR